MLVLSVALSVGLRALLPLVPSNLLVAGLILAADVISAPSGVLVDSAAASSRKVRSFGRAGWAGTFAFCCNDLLLSLTVVLM